jgi:hypothetical protein
MLTAILADVHRLGNGLQSRQQTVDSHDSLLLCCLRTLASPASSSITCSKLAAHSQHLLLLLPSHAANTHFGRLHNEYKIIKDDSKAQYGDCCLCLGFAYFKFGSGLSGECRPQWPSHELLFLVVTSAIMVAGLIEASLRSLPLALTVLFLVSTLVTHAALASV